MNRLTFDLVAMPTLVCREPHKDAVLKPNRRRERFMVLQHLRRNEGRK